MSVALLVMTDGRMDCLAASLHTAEQMLQGPITHRVMHDDTGDPEHRANLAQAFPHFEVIGAGERLGFGGAVRNAWNHLRSLDAEWVFWLEDDFEITRPVDLFALMRVMEGHPHLAQIALERQPWNERERAAGGILEQHPGAWSGHAERAGEHHDVWREHRLFFTTNPCLIRRSLTKREWPEGGESEGHFGLSLFADDPMTHCAFWGGGAQLGDGPWCEHIGHERVGAGY